MIKKSDWFTRTTGSPIRLAFTDCECHSYGRDHCFGCVAEREYPDKGPRLYEGKPRFKRITLTQADLRFLQGLPEKVFQPKRKRTWQPRRENRYH